jgi:hypothetical protein
VSSATLDRPVDATSGTLACPHCKLFVPARIVQAALPH